MGGWVGGGLLAEDAPKKAKCAEGKPLEVENGHEALVVVGRPLAHLAPHVRPPVLEERLEHEHLTINISN